MESKENGINTTYTQQYKKLQLANPTDIPRVMQNYYQTLNTFLDTITNPIILMGDFNTAALDPNLLDLQSRHNLHNLYNHKHPNQPLNTHQMGLARINQFFVSAPLLPHITRMGYKPISARIPWDHQGMYLDIQCTSLTNRNQAPQRKLRTNCYTHVLQYQSKLLKYFKQERILPRLKNLEQRSAAKAWTIHCTHQLQSLDKDITVGMFKLEKACRLCHLAPWSPTTKEQLDTIQQISNQIKKICPWVNSQGPRYPTTGLQHKQQEELWILLSHKKNAIKEIRQVRKQGYEIKGTFLQEKADIEEIKGNTRRH